jgi:hypothetical protein
MHGAILLPLAHTPLLHGVWAQVIFPLLTFMIHSTVKLTVVVRFQVLTATIMKMAVFFDRHYQLSFVCVVCCTCHRAWILEFYYKYQSKEDEMGGACGAHGGGEGCIQHIGWEA